MNKASPNKAEAGPTRTNSPTDNFFREARLKGPPAQANAEEETYNRKQYKPEVFLEAQAQHAVERVLRGDTQANT